MRGKGFRHLLHEGVELFDGPHCAETSLMGTWAPLTQLEVKFVRTSSNLAITQPVHNAHSQNGLSILRLHVMLADASGNEVKGALDPQQMTDVLTAYSAEQGMPACCHLGSCND